MFFNDYFFDAMQLSLLDQKPNSQAYIESLCLKHLKQHGHMFCVHNKNENTVVGFAISTDPLNLDPLKKTKSVQIGQS